MKYRVRPCKKECGVSYCTFWAAYHPNGIRVAWYSWQQAMDQVSTWIREDRQPVARKPRPVSPELAERLTRHSGSPVDRQCPVCGDYVYDFVQQCNECGEVLPGLPEPEDR